MNPPGVVLVVEDDDDDLFFLERELAKVGRPLIKHAPDGRVAVDYLQGSGIYADRTQYPIPDIVFLDLKTPQLSGHEVLRWIRGQRKFDQLRVYVLTGSDEPKDRAQVDAIGAAGYVVKPLLASQLKELFS